MKFVTFQILNEKGDRWEFEIYVNPNMVITVREISQTKTELQLQSNLRYIVFEPCTQVLTKLQTPVIVET